MSRAMNALRTWLNSLFGKDAATDAEPDRRTGDDRRSGADRRQSFGEPRPASEERRLGDDRRSGSDRRGS